MESTNALLHLLTGSNSPLVWSIFLLGAILGILITWAIWHSKVKGLRREIENATALSNQYEVQAKAAEEEIALKESDLKKSALENIKLRQDMKRSSDEFAVAKSELQVLKEHTEKTKTEGNAYIQQVESLENQVLGLKAKNNALTDEASKAENSNTNVEVYTLKTKLTKLNSELATALVDVKRLEGINEDLKKERDTLKVQIATPMAATVPTEVIETPDETIVATSNADEAKDESGKNGKEIPNVIPLESSPITDADIENTTSVELDSSGLPESATYSETMMESLSETTGKADSDNDPEETVKFIPIAKKPIVIKKAEESPVVEKIEEPKLAAKKPLKKVTKKKPVAKKKKVSAKKTTVKKTLRDDLKKVEGIGPKIEQLLNAAGILNWKTLAKTKPQALRDILAEAGNRYKMHDPTTWPEQSALAAKGEWDKLKTFQDFLKGGKDLS